MISDLRILKLAQCELLARYVREDELARHGNKIAENKSKTLFRELTELNEQIILKEGKMKKEELEQREIIATEIEAVSERMCIDHIGYRPHTWYYGGSAHNDDRLKATVADDGEIYVSDGNATERYDGDIDGVEGYVADWLSNVWGEF